ncbi:MAG: tetratricopeptide repeat protein, partial [Phycisphaerae bacterium]|nr:tetratricopeptide repeat protein [Phycisphaerae bacterium]
MKIMDCVDACPNDALSIGVGPIALGKRTKKKKYDLGIAEEICIAIAFLIGFFAFRSLYAVIPMLMAVGVSLVTTWVLWKAWRLLRDANAHFHGKQLKLHGKVSGKGILFLVFALVVALWTVQSATVQAFHFMGDRAMATNNNDEALWYYSKASSISDGGIALASNPNIDIEVARYFDSEHQFIDSYRLYQRIDARVGQDERSTMLLGQNMQYHAQFVPIDQLYASRLKVNLHWELVWEDYVGWLKREMQFERAIQASHKAVQSNPNAKRLRIQLALLELESGNTSTAVHIAQQLVDEDMQDPVMWRLYARALDSDGRNEKAVFALEKAKQLLAEQLQNR